jgi:hypothetical protein
VLRENLDLGLQDSVVQFVVVDRSTSHKFGPRSYGSLTPNKHTASLAKGVGHYLMRGGGGVLREQGEIILTSDVACMGIECGKIGREHRSRPLSAIRAMTNESVD